MSSGQHVSNTGAQGNQGSSTPSTEPKDKPKPPPGRDNIIKKGGGPPPEKKEK